MISSLEFRGLKRRRVLHLFDRFMLAGPAAVVQEVDWHALQARSRTGKPFLQCCLRSSYGYKKCRKNERSYMGIPVIQQAKIQAQVLVPLVKALQAELGEERANSLVRRVLGDVYRRYGEEFWRTKNEKNLGKIMASAWATYARADALDYTVIEQSQDAYEIDVTGCRYAEFYKELGEPELGFLLVCSGDFTTAEGFDPDIKLTLTQTIMQGASHCDFRYKRLKETS